MTVESAVNIESLSASFPLTFPVPSPITHPSLLSIKDLHREEDLLRNPSSFRQWWSAIHTTREAQNTLLKLEPHADIPPETRALLGPLASPTARQSLQRLTYLYEAALANFTGSYKLWKSYLQMRLSYVLGKQLLKKKAGGKKRLPDIKDAIEEEQEDLEQWEGGLDGVVGWEEWRALVATFERALMWLPKVRCKLSYFLSNAKSRIQLPRLWLMYLSIFFHQNCPPVLSHSHARRTFDRALRTLPPSLHHRIWVRYLLWAETRGGLTTVAVYRRYLAIDPSVTERYVALLLSPSNPSPRPLEAAKLLLRLSRKAARGEYISAEGKSPYQLLGDLLDVLEVHAEQVGLGIEELGSTEADEEPAGEVANDPQQLQNGNGLIRFAGPPTTVGADGKPAPAYDEDEDPNSLRRLNVEKIVHKDGLAVYKDQAGRLWTGLATFWIKRGEFERAKETFETGIATVLTIRDFTQIFDAYAEFSESVISGIMEELANPDEEDEDLDVKETEEELDAKMKEFEELMDRRPFLVNDVLLRRNPNDVQEWEKRVGLWGQDDEKVCVHGLLFSRGNLSDTSRRWQIRIHAHSPPLLRAGPHRTSTACILTLPSSTKKVGPQAKRKRTWPVPARCLRRLPRSTSRMSRTSLRSGVSGPKWKCAMSGLLFRWCIKTHAHTVAGITMMQSASCNGPPRFPRTLKSTIMTLFVL